jgi:hypothetical protein
MYYALRTTARLDRSSDVRTSGTSRDIRYQAVIGNKPDRRAFQDSMNHLEVV